MEGIWNYYLLLGVPFSYTCSCSADDLLRVKRKIVWAMWHITHGAVNVWIHVVFLVLVVVLGYFLG